MNGGLRYLAERSAQNRLRQFVTQLRKPTYLLAVVVGVAYLLMLVRAPRSQAGGFGHSATETVGALGILVLTATAWIFGGGRSLLECTGPERTLLLPAPVPASRILDFRLLALQLPVWRNVVLWTLLSGAGLGVITLAQHGVALWILLTTLQWHRLAAGRARAAGDEGSGSGGRMARILGVVLLASVPFMMSGSLGQGAGGLKVMLEGLTASPALRLLLWPFAIPLRPFTASSTTSFAAALPAAALMLGVHYFWLQHLGIDTGTSHPADRLSARGEPLWRLGPSGRAAPAFFWKNFTALLRGPAAIIATGGALLVIVTPSILRSAGREPAAGIIGWMTLVWGVILVVVGPQFIRNDLRRDQRQLELLRTLPVRGFDVLLGSAGAAACALALGVSSLLVAGLLGTWGSPELPIPESLQGQALAGALLIVGPLCLAGILIQDGALLLFPDWSRLTAQRGSPTALGANIANSALTLLLLGLLLIAPAGAGLAAAGGLDAPWAPIRFGLIAGLLLGTECWMLLRWLGSRYDGLQPIRTTS